MQGLQTGIEVRKVIFVLVRPKRKIFGVGPLLFAFLAQGLVLLLAVSVVVIGPIFREEPDFTAKKTIYLPQRELEHRVSVAEFQELAQPPALLQRLAVDSLRPQNLPALPDLPSVDFSPISMNAPVMDPSFMLGQTGLMGGLGEIGAEVSNFSFFGLEGRAKRIVICFDISGSVKNKIEQAGLTMDLTKEETKRLIEQLNANTLFGFIQFSRQYDPFRGFLVAATQDNKAMALAWLDAEFRTDGKSAPSWIKKSPNGIQSVLEAAFALDPAPDAIILVSDGSFQRTPSGGGTEDVPWDELEADIMALQAGLPEPATIHFFGFRMSASDKAAMSKIVRRYRGRLREL